MAYILENRYGNIRYSVDTERERDELIKRGFKPIEEKQKAKGGKSSAKNKNNPK